MFARGLRIALVNGFLDRCVKSDGVLVGHSMGGDADARHHRAVDAREHMLADPVTRSEVNRRVKNEVLFRAPRNAELGREQAKQYCHNIQARHNGELPFCFYTNGHEIFFWNLGEAPPQRAHGFPTRQDLERLLYIL